MRALASIAAVLLLSANAAAASAALNVGSKKFTESVILGELSASSIRASGTDAVHLAELGGTAVLWKALVAGEIDVYPEYTGTLRFEILAAEDLGEDVSDDDLAALLVRFGVRMSGPLGFNNSYALGMKEELAARLGISSISDLSRHPQLRYGFTNEFMQRSDGWPGLRRRYRLSPRSARGLDHDLAYRGLDSDGIDVTDLYTTDAEILYYRLRVLDDDAGYFPTYQAVLLYRDDLALRAPAAVNALLGLEGVISAEEMTAMNAEVKLGKESERDVARAFLEDEVGLSAAASPRPNRSPLLRHTIDHLRLVGISLSAAILLAIPLGIACARREPLARVVLATVGIIQTVPSLALLVFMIPLLGIGGPPAIAALFLYSLLPIVRNTYTGLTEISPPLIESAAAMGLPPAARLRLVELPLATRSILAGVKTSAVINVGTATLGALIGAGGYGQPILTGIRLDDTSLILQGAVPAAVLALAVQGLFDLVEVVLIPKGLRCADVLR